MTSDPTLSFVWSSSFLRSMTSFLAWAGKARDNERVKDKAASRSGQRPEA